MLVECYILIAWVAMLLVGLVGFSLVITLKYYGLVSRPTRDMNILYLVYFGLIAWIILLLVGLVAFVHGY